MVLIIIVEKTGTLKELAIKDGNIENVYKSVKPLKSLTESDKQTTWNISNNSSITLYAKTDGRAGQENKYDFPPPVDNSLFFGPCVLIHKNKSNKMEDLNVALWKVIYEKLFGGFEDIGDEDSEDEEDDDDEDTENKTKQGYSKDDGFVVEDDDDEEDNEEDNEEDEVDEVDDDDEEDDDDDEDDEDEDEDEKPIKPRVQPKRAAKKIENVFITTHSIEENYINCDSELSEEDYV